MQLLKVVKKRASCYSPSSVSLFELILVNKSDQSVLSLSRNTSKLTTFKFIFEKMNLSII